MGGTSCKARPERAALKQVRPTEKFFSINGTDIKGGHVILKFLGVLKTARLKCVKNQLPKNHTASLDLRKAEKILLDLLEEIGFNRFFKLDLYPLASLEIHITAIKVDTFHIGTYSGKRDGTITSE